MVEYGIVGEISIDYIVTSENQVYEGILGGSAAYAAAGARLWADSVGIVARVGTDLPPPLLATLQDHGIDLHFVHQLPHIKTRRCFTAYETPSRRAEGPPASHYLRLGRNLPKDLLPVSRAATLNPGPKASDPLPSDLPKDLTGLHAIHLAGLNWESASLLSRALREARVEAIVYEPPDELMRPERRDDISVLLRDVNAFLPSLEQARSLFRADRLSTWEMAEAFGEMGPAVVLLKDGLGGLSLYDVVGDERWSIPSYPNAIVDLTGADSTLCGGFLTGLAELGDPLEAALRGAVSSSLAVEGTGPCYPLAAMPGLAGARLKSLQQTSRRA